MADLSPAGVIEQHAVRPSSIDVTPWIAMSAVLIAGIAARAWLLFSTPLVPGMNGAYYLIQARALLEKGTLGISTIDSTQ